MHFKKIMATSLLVASALVTVVPVVGHDEDKQITATVTQTNLSVAAKEVPIKEETIVGIGKPLPTTNNNEKEKRKRNYKTGYLKTNTNIRKQPNMSSDIFEVYPMNKKIKYCKHSDAWSIIKYKDSIAYVHNSLIVNEPIYYKEYNIPKNSGFKSYMPYTAITAKSSPQYKLQQIAYTGDYGIRQVDGRYCIAIGTAFNATIGTYCDLVLQNGSVIKCIVSDIKSSKHTESNNIVTAHNGCVSEFLVCSKSLNSNAKRDGDISSCKGNWDSPVMKILIYNKNVL